MAAWRRPAHSQALWLALAAAALFAFQALRLDFPLSRLFFRDGAGFPLRDAWWLAVPGHTGLRLAALCAWGALVAVALVPVRVCKDWRGPAGLAALGMALSWAAVIALRAASAHSCPVELAEFGGQASWFPLFGSTAQPGPGRCLPSGHAVSGFGFLSAYFALRGSRPRAARLALALALLLGLLATAVQVLRGSHLVSHGLWTGWICWGVSAALDRAARGAAAAPPLRAR